MSAHKYELMFIADPELDERGLKKSYHCPEEFGFTMRRLTQEI
jgi:hypothetical protein